MNLKEQLLAGNKRAIARLISLVENGDETAFDILKECYVHTGNSHVIGITGAPGVGKSSLTGELIREYRNLGKKVGVVAVDPSSSFTGGALLGDRVRMIDHFTDPGVFIRSLGSRGALGGITPATSFAVNILDIAGYDIILVETVGVGQAEIDIVKHCDTTLVAMIPGLGDDIQAIKAGIMEIGDIFVLNKGHLPGAKKAKNELEGMLMMRKDSFPIPVVLVEELSSDGIQPLFQALKSHQNFLNTTEEGELRRLHNIKEEIRELAKTKILGKLYRDKTNKQLTQQLAELVLEKKKDPFSARDELYNSLYQ